MNVTARQGKEKNEETKTGKGKAGEERRQAAHFEETAGYPLRLLRGSMAKMVCVRGVPEVTGTIRKANSRFDPTQTGSVVVR